jgi:hypothetical protein
MYQSAQHLYRASRLGWRTRLRRAAGRDGNPGNPLRRRMVRTRVPLAWAVFLAPVLVVSAAVAMVVYHADWHTAAVQAAHRHAVSATTLAAAPSTGALRWGPATEGKVLAQWRYPADRVRTGTVTVPEGAAQGSVVRIWVDDAGRLARPPRTTDDIAFASVSSGVAAFAGLMPACWCAYAAYGRRVDARVAAAWERDWERVEPRWSGRFGSA